ncbi:MAG: MCE family protein [Candidatus Omnitrophica bacterium]|nr:MCE family protein [Candidatus Omnitrophota bacterium]
MGVKANDFKIGLLVLAALAALLALSYQVNNLAFVRGGYGLNVTFVNSAGIEKNAPVRLSGVEVGTVKDLKITYGPEGTRVLLNLWLKKNALVREDSEAFVTTLGLMGEKYLEITAGDAEANFLRPDSTIIGREPFDTNKFIEKGEQIAENLDQTISEIRKLSSGVNEVVEFTRQDLDKMMKNLAESSENIKAFTEDIKWHPWKLIRKSKSPKPEEVEKEKQKKR